ncbi:type I secretion system permease/ATPase [Salinarimonas soli]|uniref:type I secretion system permease/ATPase n=1 Tax=Salinarimonas soli TaxID=1638099 RepID=UPI001F0A14B4|nr:type I secretion system permease/ATPase [Salinarimonas soli]
MSRRITNQAQSELLGALKRCRGAFIAVAVMSGLLNVLALTGSFYMLEIYDRVLPSRSLPTLVGFSIVALMLFGSQGLLDVIRARILVRVGNHLDEALGRRAFEVLVRLPLRGKRPGESQQPVRELDQVRGFLSGLGPTALFDLPWMPLYLLICFGFHFWIGVTALGGAILLVSLTLATEFLTRKPAEAATVAAVQRHTMAEGARRNAEVVQAMGMAPRLAAAWSNANDEHRLSQQRAADVAGGLGAISKILRMVLQSGVLGVAAYLVIQGQASAGMMIASSILVSRALAPVELAIAHWKGFIGARTSWAQLNRLLQGAPRGQRPMALPRPTASVSVEGVACVPPDSNRIVVHEATFALKAGSALGVIGPSGSGKSSLARVLVGVWEPARGRVRLDGAALEQWDPVALGPHIGYLPQSVELFAGTVAQNIARFDPEAEPEAIIAAAKAANVHDLILRLPEGYETPIGENGSALSAGQRQRVALARALYGDPFFVVLDEPNSNLDSEGEQALTQAILSVRARGGTVVVIAHRPSALAGVDLVMLMNEGRVQAFGPRDEVLTQTLKRPQAMPAAPGAPQPQPQRVAGVAGAASGAALKIVHDGTEPQA